MWMRLSRPVLHPLARSSLFRVGPATAVAFSSIHRAVSRQNIKIRRPILAQMMEIQASEVSVQTPFGGDSPLSEVVPSEEDLPAIKPKRRRSTRRTSISVPFEHVIEEATAETVKTTRKRRKTSSAKATTVDVVPLNAAGDGDEMTPTRRKSKRVKKPVVSLSEDDIPVEDLEGKPKRRQRRKTPEEDRTYEIAPIEQVLQTNFRGRLGYACLNTILRKRKPPVFCARTCRIDTIKKEGLSYVKELGRQNVIDLCELIRWNEANNIKFMRMSSEMFPFASHQEYGYNLEYVDKELKDVGELASQFGHRLTTHPGQFTQLGSPREEVITSSFRELEYHCEMMDRMGLGKDSVMIIHMGGVFGDREATLARFRENYAKLSDNIKARLVLENDELCYNVDDLLPVCMELNIPLIFDYHHDWIYPSTRPPSELIPVINELWYRKGIKPKQHCSEPRPGAVTVMEKRAHSDRIKRLPEHCPDDMDLMLECKDKEQACLYLYRLYNLYDVNPRVLRPPAEVEALHTQGRKSNKRKKKDETSLMDNPGKPEAADEDRDGDHVMVANDEEEVPCNEGKEDAGEGNSFEGDTCTENLIPANEDLKESDCCSADDEKEEVETHEELVMGNETLKRGMRDLKNKSKEGKKILAKGKR